MLNCHLCIFFGKMSVQVLGPCFSQVVCFIVLRVLCILDNSPLSALSDVSSTNVFRESLPCLFILLTLSFAEQKWFMLMKVQFINYFSDGSCLWSCL